VFWREPSLLSPTLGDSDDAYIIEIPLPGIRRKDAQVEIRGRRVVVTGERKERTRRGTFRTKRRVTGRFRFDARLPGDVDTDAVTASYEDGRLVVRAPKPDQNAPRFAKSALRDLFMPAPARSGVLEARTLGRLARGGHISQFCLGFPQLRSLCDGVEEGT
jgi:HSP20 family protein